MKQILRREDFKIISVLFLIVFILQMHGSFFANGNNTSTKSIEIGIASYSPRGVSGGALIPASSYGQGYYYSQGSYIPPATCNLTLTPSSILVGETSTLAWTSSDATSGSIDQGVGSMTPLSSGSTTVNWPGPGVQTFTGTVSGAGGGGTCEATLTGTMPTPSFNSNTSINNGNSLTLIWSATGADSCDGVNFSTGGATSGSATVNPSTTTTYTVVCTYSGVVGSDTTSSAAIITIIHPVLSITANPTSVRSGKASTITWSATNVDSCTVTGPGGFSQTGTSGSASSGALTKQSVYILSCTNEGGTVSDSVVVTLIPSFEEF